MVTVWHSLSRVFVEKNLRQCIYTDYNHYIERDVRYGPYHMDNILSYLVSVVPDVLNRSLFNF